MNKWPESNYLLIHAAQCWFQIFWLEFAAWIQFKCNILANDLLLTDGQDPVENFRSRFEKFRYVIIVKFQWLRYGTCWRCSLYVDWIDNIGHCFIIRNAILQHVDQKLQIRFDHMRIEFIQSNQASRFDAFNYLGHDIHVQEFLVGFKIIPWHHTFDENGRSACSISQFHWIVIKFWLNANVKVHRLTVGPCSVESLWPIDQ